ncbi:hypothetical protein NC652_038780 [Populus alba x Populus x berolinensis]|nr:hypothetical protein NC652_038780 [Populus alba x Populus x berolinensis]
MPATNLTGHPTFKTINDYTRTQAFRSSSGAVRAKQGSILAWLDLDECKWARPIENIEVMQGQSNSTAALSREA